MQRDIIIAGTIAFLLALFGIANAVVMSNRGGGTPPPDTACTKEAMVCPDGSAVGRTGPNCEFAACPVSSDTSPVTITAHLGQKVTALGLGITPLRVLEDSRCPVGVQCIQAGTVRLSTELISGMGTSSQEFKLNQPVTTEAETITLTGVAPAHTVSMQTDSTNYTFTFTIEKRAATGGGILPYNSGIRGAVVLGPTCPVQRNPPDSKCADKPYATTVTVQERSGAPYRTIKTDSNGMFEVSLPPNSYTLIAKGGNIFPRCAETNVTVSPGKYATITLSCDTGIR